MAETETARPPLWTMSLAGLPLTVRAYNVLRWSGRYTMAWHVAALCERCVLRLRNCGKVTFVEIRSVLAHAGFPAPVKRCARESRNGLRAAYLPSACEHDLAVCRAMLERGEWQGDHSAP